MKKIILLLSIIFISGCAIVEEEKLDKIDERLSKLEEVDVIEKKDNSFIDVSFKAHIVQVG
jgi:PBP1b-binding outer membrane lipoprotein LpoB